MNAIWSQAVSDLQTALIPPANNVTMTVTRNFNGGGQLGQSNTTPDFTSYAAIQSAYLALTPSNSVQAANWTLANIPSTAPTTELGTFMAGAANLSVAIGRISGGQTATLTLGDGVTWDTSSLRGESVSGSGFTAYGVIMHELTECLGRFAKADKGGGCCPMDNFVFSAVGTHCTTQATTRYISIGGGGVTPILYNMDTNASDDAGDTAGPNNSPAFAGSTGPQAIISRSSSLPLQAADWQWLSLLGYNLSAQGTIWAGLSAGTTAGGFSLALMGAHGR
jgi:hypothetical protein